MKLIHRGNFKFPSSHSKRVKSNSEINLNNIFWLIQYIQNIVISIYNQYKTIIIDILHIFSY